MLQECRKDQNFFDNLIFDAWIFLGPMLVSLMTKPMITVVILRSLSEKWTRNASIAKPKNGLETHLVYVVLRVKLNFANFKNLQKSLATCFQALTQGQKSFKTTFGITIQLLWWLLLVLIKIWQTEASSLPLKIQGQCYHRIETTSQSF